MLGLRDRTIIVTGGSGGIGEAVVRVCVEAEARVLFCARGTEAIKSTLARLDKAGVDRRRVHGMCADISNAADVTRVFCESAQRFGSVNGVIHTAAVLGPIGSICDVEPRDWLEALEVDLYGAFLVVREACRHMRAGAGGRIALFSGGGASSAFPYYSAYACSKVGVVRLTETVAKEMSAFGISINCVAPGFVATNIHAGTLHAGPVAAGSDYFDRTVEDLKRGGVPPEIGARAAAFLVSNAAEGITGKFVSAVHDAWEEWPLHIEELADSDIFTLRRILPRERGMDWQ